MTTVALVGNKGGAGKTTLAINLAAGFSRAGSTAVLDADPQRSVLQWHAMADVDTGLSVADAVDDPRSAVDDVVDAFEHVIVDCPPSVESPQTQAALRFVDIALIPVQPSPLDIWASVHIEREVAAARQENPNIRPLLVINQLEPNTRLSRMIRQALAELSVPAAETAIRRRMAYRMSVLEGRTVFETGKRGLDASVEIQQLIDEVMSL